MQTLKPIVIWRIEPDIEMHLSVGALAIDSMGQLIKESQKVNAFGLLLQVSLAQRVQLGHDA
jgi:hypothetical protein